MIGTTSSGTLMVLFGMYVSYIHMRRLPLACGFGGSPCGSFLTIGLSSSEDFARNITPAAQPAMQSVVPPSVLLAT